MESMSGVTRRDFLQTSVAGMAGMAVAGPGLSAQAGREAVVAEIARQHDATVQALRESGANSFHAVNIFEDPELRDALKKFSNWPTYPQLYVKGELVGGCDIMLDMYRSGELKKLLTEAGATS